MRIFSVDPCFRVNMEANSFVCFQDKSQLLQLVLNSTLELLNGLALFSPEQKPPATCGYSSFECSQCIQWRYKIYTIYHIIITKGLETHQSIITCGNKTLDIKLNRTYNSNLLDSFNFLEMCPLPSLVHHRHAILATWETEPGGSQFHGPFLKKKKKV